MVLGRAVSMGAVITDNTSAGANPLQVVEENKALLKAKYEEAKALGQKVRPESGGDLLANGRREPLNSKASYRPIRQ